MAEQAAAPSRNVANNQRHQPVITSRDRVTQLAKEIICKVFSFVFILVGLLLLWEYHYFQTQYIFCESKPDTCLSQDIELLPQCPNETIYIDIQDDYFIVDALFGQDSYNFSNYPLAYNCLVRTVHPQ